MDMNDILHSLYFTMEWGIQTDENDKTFDTEFTPRAAQNSIISGRVLLETGIISIPSLINLMISERMVSKLKSLKFSNVPSRSVKKIIFKIASPSASSL